MSCIGGAWMASYLLHRIDSGARNGKRIFAASFQSALSILCCNHSGRIHNHGGTQGHPYPALRYYEGSSAEIGVSRGHCRMCRISLETGDNSSSCHAQMNATRTVCFRPRGGTEQLTELVVVPIGLSRVAESARAECEDSLLCNQIDSSQFRQRGLAH